MVVGLQVYPTPHPSANHTSPSSHDNGEGQQLALGDSSAAAGMAARLDNGEGQQLALGDSSVDIA
jgi:hypothetical protein